MINNAKEKNKKKYNLNFEPSSPIGNNNFNFEDKGSEIKKIDEGNVNFDKDNTEKNNDKIKANDSNVFNFEYGENNKKPERNESKDTFNFNTIDSIINFF